MNSREWRTYKLGDIVEVVQGLAINSKTKYLIQDTGLPLLRITDLFNNTQVQFINPDEVPNQVIANENEIIYTRTGQVGYVFKGRTGVVHNNCFKVIPIDNKVDKDFLYWFLFQETIRDYANAIASGSVQKDLTHPAFKSIDIKVPPLDIQRRIAAILSVLDDKIELNRQTNTTLEAIAQGIFKEWFVNFKFPGATGEMEESELGLIPTGWRVGKVRDLCEVNNNSITKNDQFNWIDYIEISQVSEGKIVGVTHYLFGEEPSRAKRKLKHGDTVLSTVRPNRGSYFLAINPPETFIASTGFAVFSPAKVPYSFLYLLLTDSEKLEYYGHVADGAAYPAINPNLIMEMDLVIPEDRILNQFHSVTESIFYKMFLAEQESQFLTQIRDNLLPKLMRGEIDV